MSTYDLSFVAEVSGVAAGLAKIPKMTEEAAAKAALAQVTASRKAAQKAQKEQEDAAKKAASGWSNAFKGVAKIAGFGELAEQAGALSGGMEGAALASGVAVAGVAALGVAALGAAAAAVSLVRVSRDAIEQFDKLGVKDIITKTQRENIKEANDALDAVGVAAQATSVAIASGLAPRIEALATSFVTLELFAAKVAGAFSTGALSFDAWSIALLVALTPVKLAIDGLNMMNQALGISNPGIEASAQLVDGWAAGLADASVSVHANTKEQRESLAVSTDAAKMIHQVGVANEKGTEAYRKHAEAVKAAAEQYKEQLGAMRELGIIGQKANEDQLDAAAKLAVARDDELVKIGQLETRAIEAAKKRGALEDEFTEITAEAAAARADVEARYARDQTQLIADEYVKRAAEVKRGEDLIAAMVGDAAASKVVKPWQEARDQMVESWDKATEKAAAYLDGLGLIAEAAGNIASLAQSYHETKLANYREDLAAAKKNMKSQDAGIRLVGKIEADVLKDKIDQQQKAAKRAFRGGQVAAIAGALIAGAQSALAMIPGIALAMGPAAAGAPAVAAGIAAAATAVQVGIIAAQKPPKFARGGVVGIEAEVGEGIANKRAMATPGFAKQLDDANMGQSSGGGSNATNVFLNDRLLMSLYGRMKRLAGEMVPPQLERA